MPQLSHLLTFLCFFLAGLSALQRGLCFLLPSSLLCLLVKPSWSAGAAGPAGSVHSNWKILSDCSAVSFESICSSTLSDHLVFEGFLLFVWFGFFIGSKSAVQNSAGPTQLSSDHTAVLQVIKRGTKPSCWTRNFCEVHRLCLRL